MNNPEMNNRRWGVFRSRERYRALAMDVSAVRKRFWRKGSQNLQLHHLGRCGSEAENGRILVHYFHRETGPPVCVCVWKWSGGQAVAIQHHRTCTLAQTTTTTATAS